MVLLGVRNVSKTFPIEGGVFRGRVGEVRALKEVSFDLNAGESLALVGGSGSGKSTLAKIIGGLLRADAGALLWEGRLLDSFSRRERAGRIQMIFQDPYASLNPKLSVGTQLGEVVRLAQREQPSDKATQRSSNLRTTQSLGRSVAELLEAVGLSADAFSHYPFQFSGGQRQRIAIARALAMDPKLLIADEPLSALDVTTQAQILDLFAQLGKSQRLTFLFITHDLAVANAFSDRIVVLKEGRVVEEGATRTVLGRPRDPYTQALLEAVPKIPALHTPGGPGRQSGGDPA